jgi:hypothetical protein
MSINVYHIFFKWNYGLKFRGYLGYSIIMWNLVHKCSRLKVWHHCTNISIVWVNIRGRHMFNRVQIALVENV